MLNFEQNWANLLRFTGVEVVSDLVQVAQLDDLCDFFHVAVRMFQLFVQNLGLIVCILFVALVTLIFLIFDNIWKLIGAITCAFFVACFVHQVQG